MSTKPRLNVITTSTRPGRTGTLVTSWFAHLAQQHPHFDVHVVDLAELNLPFLDEPAAAVDRLPYEHAHTRAWSALTSAADAYVFVLPEYNHSYPASVKNALDFLYYEWNHKPAAFVSYGMTSGGLRSAEALKPVLSALKMMPINETVVVHLRQVLDTGGQFQASESMEKAAGSLLSELHRLSAAMQPLRATLPS